MEQEDSVLCILITTGGLLVTMTMGIFVGANGEAWVCKDGEFKSLPTNRYVIDCRYDKEAIKYFMHLCENIFEKDDYSDMVGG